jgi:hypothetical protein
MIIHIDEADAYHEGGHAAMFWHYGIALEYVSIEPDLDRGYGGLTVPLPRPHIVGRVDLENEMRISAAGDAAESHIRRRSASSAEYLISKFELAVADIISNPDSVITNDTRNFVVAARARDDELREAGQDGDTGPANWVPIWLEAESMIRGTLWAAVTEVAKVLARSSPHRIDGDTAAAVMTAAARPA